MRRITMGSLFDGIGGFPLAAIHNGVVPLSGSEFLKLRTRCGTTILRFYISLLITI